MFTRLSTVNDSWKLGLITAELDANNIAFEIVEVPREYASVVTGMGDKSFDLLVTQKDLQKARSVLLKFENKHMDNEKPLEPNYFKKSVMQSVFGAVMLPLVFNYFATKSYLKMCDQKHSIARRVVALAFLILGWLVAIFAVYSFIDYLK